MSVLLDGGMLHVSFDHLPATQAHWCKSMCGGTGAFAFRVHLSLSREAVRSRICRAEKRMARKMGMSGLEKVSCPYCRYVVLGGNGKELLIAQAEASPYRYFIEIAGKWKEADIPTSSEHLGVPRETLRTRVKRFKLRSDETPVCFGLTTDHVFEFIL